MKFDEFITERTSQIATAAIMSGKANNAGELRIKANKWCGAPSDYESLDGNFSQNLQRYVLSSATKEEYGDIVFLKNPFIFGIIIHVKSSRQIFVHKSVKAAQTTLK